MGELVGPVLWSDEAEADGALQAADRLRRVTAVCLYWYSDRQTRICLDRGTLKESIAFLPGLAIVRFAWPFRTSLPRERPA